MKLIVGLGNPGKKYFNTRHNVGFAVADLLARDKRFSPWKVKKKFQAHIAERNIVHEKILLAKPQTYMNRSGNTVAELAKYFHLAADDIMVIHDDLDLPLATLRITKNSTSGGHHGVDSIINCLGSRMFVRFRIGIAKEDKTGMSAEQYVLQTFTRGEQKKINSVVGLTIEAVEFAINSGVLKAMNKFN